MDQQQRKKKAEESRAKELSDRESLEELFIPNYGDESDNLEDSVDLEEMIREEEQLPEDSKTEDVPRAQRRRELGMIAIGRGLVKGLHSIARALRALVPPEAPLGHEIPGKSQSDKY